MRCRGVLIKPQFSQSVLYAQAQSEAFPQATALPSATQPMIAAAKKEATTIIGGNFTAPTLNALDPQVSIPTELTQSLRCAPPCRLGACLTGLDMAKGKAQEGAHA